MGTKVIDDHLWTHMERLGRHSPKMAAIAYVSSSIIRFGSGDIVVTDASPAAITSAQTSASVLLRAALAGAKVYSLPKLHAKVLVTASGAVIGSANLSKSSRRLREAAILTTNSRILRALKQLVARFSAEGRPLSVAELRKLCMLPVTRSNARPPGAAPRLSLLEALRAHSPLLDTVAFSWYASGADLTKSQVEAVARKRKLPLPANRRWDWFESAPTRGALSRTRRICEGRGLVSWEVEWDDDNDHIENFKPHDESAAPFIDAFVFKGSLVSVYGAAPARTPFDIRRDRRRLAQAMTAGLNRASAKLRQALADADQGFMSLSQVRKLVALGSAAA